jgi:hypothetical protein
MACFTYWAEVYLHRFDDVESRIEKEKSKYAETFYF